MQSTRSLALARAVVAFLFVLAAPVYAQVPGAASPPDDVRASGTAYFVFSELGAPTVEVIAVGEGGRSGIYRLQEGTTLTEFLALSGGGVSSSETDRQIVEAFVRVLRRQGGERAVIYEATVEQAIREPDLHPEFQDGDIVETDVTYETLAEPFTWRDGLEITSRVASLVLLVLRLTSL